MPEISDTIEIYSDGSCNQEYKIGGWASIVIIKNKEILLKGEEFETTHNRMELLSFIKAIEYLESLNLGKKKIRIISDSQYLINLTERKNKLKAKKFKTGKGKSIQNIDLVEKIIYYIENIDIEFVKIKAHQKRTEIRNINREVDKISRQIVRNNVQKSNFK